MGALLKALGLEKKTVITPNTPAPAPSAPAPTPKPTAPTMSEALDQGKAALDALKRREAAAGLKNGGDIDSLRGFRRQKAKASGKEVGVDLRGFIKGPGGIDKVPARVDETGEEIRVGAGERILNKAQNTALAKFVEKEAGTSLDSFLEKATDAPVGPTYKDGLRHAQRGANLPPLEYERIAPTTTLEAAQIDLDRQMEEARARQAAADAKATVQPGQTRQAPTGGDPDVRARARADAQAFRNLQNANMGPQPSAQSAGVRTMPTAERIGQMTPQQIGKQAWDASKGPLKHAASQTLNNMSTIANSVTAGGDVAMAAAQHPEGTWGQVRDTAAFIPRMLLGAAGADVDTQKLQRGMAPLEAGANALGGFLTDRIPNSKLGVALGLGANAYGGFRPGTAALSKMQELKGLGKETPIQEMYRKAGVSQENMPGPLDTMYNAATGLTSDGAPTTMERRAAATQQPTPDAAAPKGDAAGASPAAQFDAHVQEAKADAAQRETLRRQGWGDNTAAYFKDNGVGAYTARHKGYEPPSSEISKEGPTKGLRVIDTPSGAVYAGRDKNGQLHVVSGLDRSAKENEEMRAAEAKRMTEELNTSRENMDMREANRLIRSNSVDDQITGHGLLKQYRDSQNQEREDRRMAREEGRIDKTYDLGLRKLKVDEARYGVESKRQAKEDADKDAKDTYERLQKQFLRPELKDGKPTGKDVPDDMAIREFMQVAVPEMANDPQRPVDFYRLSRPEQDAIIASYMTRRKGSERIKADLRGMKDAPTFRGDIDPGAQGLRTDSLNFSDLFDRKSSVGIGDVWDSWWKNGDHDRVALVRHGAETYRIPKTRITREGDNVDTDAARYFFRGN